MTHQNNQITLDLKSLERRLRWWSALALTLVILLSFYWFGKRTKQLVYSQNRVLAAEMVGTALTEAHSRIVLGTPDTVEDEAKYRDLIGHGTQLGTEFEWQAILPTGNEEQGAPAGPTLERLLVGYSSARLQEGSAHDAASLPAGIAPFDRVIETDAGQAYQYYRPIYAASGCVDCHRTSVATPQPDLEAGELLAVMRISFDHGPMAKRLAEDAAMLWMAAIVTGFLSLLVLWLGIRLVISRPLTQALIAVGPPATSPLQSRE